MKFNAFFTLKKVKFNGKKNWSSTTFELYFLSVEKMRWTSPPEMYQISNRDDFRSHPPQIVHHNAVPQLRLLKSSQPRGLRRPITGEPLSLALENVAILWWATPPENWRARQWLTSNRSPQSAGPWHFHEQKLRNCIVVDILWWVAPENATIRNLVHFRWWSSTHFLH